MYTYFFWELKEIGSESIYPFSVEVFGALLSTIFVMYSFFACSLDVTGLKILPNIIMTPRIFPYTMLYIFIYVSPYICPTSTAECICF